jgi:hypothetical protein
MQRSIRGGPLLATFRRKIEVFGAVVNDVRAKQSPPGVTGGLKNPMMAGAY